MKKIYRYTVFALIMLLGAYQIAIAGPGQGRGNNQPGNQNQPPVNYVEALQLTDEQVSKIGILFQNSHNTLTGLEDKMHTANHQLQEIQWSKEFTPEKVEGIMKEIRDSMALLQLNHEKLMVDIRFLLTPEQLQRFYEIQSRLNEQPGEEKPMSRLFGKIMDFNLAEKTFHLVTTDPEGKELVFKVLFHENTKFQRNNKPVKPDEFKNGEEVTVVGHVMIESKTIEAMMVMLGKMEPPRNPNP